MRASRAAIPFVVLLAVGFMPSLAPGQNTAGAFAEAKGVIRLPAPVASGGMSLTDALARRRSQRSFAGTPLTQQEISQLLWAAQGITDNRGHRTAPSARGRYFLHVYVADREGLFEYLPEGHKLRQAGGADIRMKLSNQAAVQTAPAVVLITGDYDRAIQSLGSDSGARCVDLEAGHAAQNLLLQATALGLGAVPAGGIDRSQVTAAAALPATSRPIYLIPVGHAK